LLVFIPATVQGINKDSLLKMIKIDMKKEPYLSLVGGPATLVDVIKTLCDWIKGYIMALVAIPDV